MSACQAVCQAESVVSKGGREGAVPPVKWPMEDGPGQMRHAVRVKAQCIQIWQVQSQHIQRVTSLKGHNRQSQVGFASKELRRFGQARSTLHATAVPLHLSNNRAQAAARFAQFPSICISSSPPATAKGQNPEVGSICSSRTCTARNPAPSGPGPAGNLAAPWSPGGTAGPAGPP